MQLLKERILKDGVVKPGNILKVGGRCAEGGRLLEPPDGH